MILAIQPLSHATIFRSLSFIHSFIHSLGANIVLNMNKGEFPKGLCFCHAFLGIFSRGKFYQELINVKKGIQEIN